MTNYPQELAQDAVCQSRTGHMTGLWFLPARPLRLNTNEWILEWCCFILAATERRISSNESRRRTDTSLILWLIRISCPTKRSYHNSRYLRVIRREILGISFMPSATRSCYLTLNIPRGVLWGPQRVIFCDPAVTVTTNLLLIFVCVPHQLKINIMQLDL